MKNQELNTIYISGAFGVQKIEAKLTNYGTKEYAQYKDAPFIHYTPKGKRKIEGIVKGYHPYIIILKGVNHPSLDDAFGPVSQRSEDVSCKMTRYGSFDERYLTEFDAKIEEYLKSQTVLMDVRYTVRTNIINK